MEGKKERKHKGMTALVELWIKTTEAWTWRSPIPEEVGKIQPVFLLTEECRGVYHAGGQTHWTEKRMAYCPMVSLKLI